MDFQRPLFHIHGVNSSLEVTESVPLLIIVSGHNPVGYKFITPSRDKVGQNHSKHSYATTPTLIPG